MVQHIITREDRRHGVALSRLVGDALKYPTIGGVFSSLVINDGDGAAALNALGLGGVFSVTDYGAVGGGSTDDTAAIQAAFAAVGTSNGIVFFPPGEYKVSSVITIANPCTVMGTGQGFGSGSTATLRASTAADDIFEVTTAQGVVFRDLAFGSSVARNSGAFDIRITSDGIDTNKRTRFEGLYFQGSGNAIGLSAARFWVVRDCFFDQIGNFSIYHPNTGFNDQGDNFVFGNAFVGAAGCQAHLYTEESCAIYVVGNKFFDADYGIWHNAKDDTGTYQIVGNSFEEQENAHILFQQATAGKIFGQININANEFSILTTTPTNPTVFLAQGAAQWLFRVNISDNVFNHLYNVNLNAISIQDGDGVIVANNVIDHTGQALPGGITVGGNATNVQVLDNVFLNMTTAQRYKNGLTAGTVVRDLGGITVADLGGWGNGSQLYVTDGTFGSNPLSGSGSGAFARRINGAWVGT